MEETTRSVTPTEVLPRSRHPKFDRNQADRICALISTSCMGLRRLRLLDPSLPTAETIMAWLARNETFAQLSARARELQADHIMDEAMEIADTERVGKRTENRVIGRKCSVCGLAVKWESRWIHQTEKTPLCASARAEKVIEQRVTIGDNVERSRQQIDLRKFLAAKLAPKKYGDQLQLNQRLVDEHGKDRPLTLADYDARMAKLRAARDERIKKIPKTLEVKALPAPAKPL